MPVETGIQVPCLSLLDSRIRGNVHAPVGTLEDENDGRVPLLAGPAVRTVFGGMTYCEIVVPVETDSRGLS